MPDPLLHLTATAGWRAALAAGVVAPTPGAGFVHLSTPDQVTLPAHRLFSGRDDVVLLAVDPAGLDVRFEPGLPDDPPGMRFPHAYGRVPTSAIVAVLPYRSGAAGFPAPPTLPTRADGAARAAVFEPSLLRRTATAEVPVRGGVAVLTSDFPASHQHNQLLLGDPDGTAFDAATAVADADRVLGGAGLPHRTVRLVGPHAAATAHDLHARGWTVSHVVTMTAPAGAMTAPAADAGLGRVEQVDLDDLRPARIAAWHRRAAAPDEVAQLVDRYRAVDAVLDLRHLAVRIDGEVVASAVLLIDGATALLDDVETEPDHRGVGHGNALVGAALTVAAGAGCDLVTLDAHADDFPRRWYGRRGFAEVGEAWGATRARTPG